MEYFARKYSCRLFIVNILQGMGGGGWYQALASFCPQMARIEDAGKD
jgi:hypothetical protein